MLMSAPDGDVSSHPCLLNASFPLVPWSNRIGSGRFSWAERDIQLTLNFAPENHAHHGVGLDDAWQVEAQSQSSVTLTLEHEPDSRWPWAFSARQVFIVTTDSLTITLSVRNLADIAVPLAFGYHPYFDRQGASLLFKAERVWMNDSQMLPTVAERPTGIFDFAEHGALEGRCVDHCYTGWDGAARIAWEGRPLALAITSGLPAAVVYVPEGGKRFCFEPVPHSTDAINRTDADPHMPIIDPGDSFESGIRMTAVRV